MQGEGKKDKLYIFALRVFITLLSVFRVRFLFNNLINRVVRNTIVNVNNLRFTPVDYASLFILSSSYEQWNVKYLARALKKGDVFLDVGAHVGKYTIPAAKIVGDNGLVISIEPQHLTFKVLNKNISLNQLRNVKVFNIAGWNESCKLRLYDGMNSGTYSCKKNILIQIGNMHPQKKFVIISAKPIDDIIRGLKVNVDYIKVDAAGAEFEVLQGLKQTLLTHRPVVLVDLLKSNQDKTLSFLNQLGYRIEITHSHEGLEYEGFLVYPQEKQKQMHDESLLSKC
jgi:FkbM family methyltransferase